MVAVLLPGGEYQGTVTDLLPGYNWSDDLYLRVTGIKPCPFETICRAENAKHKEFEK